MELKNVYIINIIIAIILFFDVIFLPSSLATDYYADLEIEVDNSGFVTINGVTNQPDLLAESTEIYTSKKQSFWLLNITKNEVFSDFVFTLTLPKNSEINYVESSGSVIIGEELGSLVVKGFGENESLLLLVQYKTEKTIEEEGIFGFDFFTIMLFVFIIVLIILFFIVLLFMDKQKKLTTVEKIEGDQDINLRGLNDRQKNIVKLLTVSKRALTQTEIQHELDIPKAAVSRNIRGLELKGLIEKEQIGMSNLIRLKNP
jgi:predicted DNA-binding transcriptional regulator